MPITLGELESVLNRSFPEADEIEVRDMVGDQDHYSLSLIHI